MVELTFSLIPEGLLKLWISFFRTIAAHAVKENPTTITHLLIAVQQSIEFVPIHLWQSIGTCLDRLFEFS